MRSAISMVCLAAAVLASTLAQAATVEPIQGDLSINQGQGFQRVNGPIDANVGDSVMVGPGGAAAVVYSDGCRVRVQPGAVVSIAPLSPCASGSLAAELPLPPLQQPEPGYDPGVWIGVGLVAVGVGLGIWGLIEAERKPASP